LVKQKAYEQKRVEWRKLVDTRARELYRIGNARDFKPTLG
jgi:hypothetical protein